MRSRFHVKKGDNVEVIAGNFRGSSGKILEVLPKKQRVLVEGVRIIKKHMRKSQDHPQGQIAQREGPIHISNVLLVCPDCGPTRIGHRFEGDTKVRVCRKCGNIIAAKSKKK